MRTIIVVLVALLFVGCAGLTFNTQHNEMFNPTDEADGEAAIKHAPSFHPTADVLAGLTPEQVVAVLTAYADAAAQWQTYAPTWTQTIGSDIETQGQLEARFRAMVAKEIAAALEPDEPPE